MAHDRLEISIVPLSTVLATLPAPRLDSTYFTREGIAVESTLRDRPSDELCSVSSSILSFGAYALTNEFTYQEAGVPFLRCTDFRGGFVSFADNLFIDEEAHKLLNKSAIEPETVLLTMSGTVGQAAVALPEWNYPINSNQDVAKIRVEGIDPYFLATFFNSEYGQAQMRRLPVGSVQQHIFLSMIERLRVARFSDKLEAAIGALARKAYLMREGVGTSLAEAQEALLASLNVGNWSPPRALSFLETVGSVKAAGRFDADYFHPKHVYLEEVVCAGDFAVLADLAEFVRSGPAWPSSTFVGPDDQSGLPFVRIRNCKPGLIDVDLLDRLSPDGVAAFDVPMACAGDIAIGMDGIQWFYAGVLEGGAYINQRVGWVRLFEAGYDPLLLQLVINSPIGQAQLLRRMTIAQTVGHITLEDIRTLKVPLLSSDDALSISNHLRDAVAKKKQSVELLNRAKRVVEIAIRSGEEEAMQLLDKIAS